MLLCDLFPYLAGYCVRNASLRFSDEGVIAQLGTGRCPWWTTRVRLSGAAIPAAPTSSSPARSGRSAAIVVLRTCRGIALRFGVKVDATRVFAVVARVGVGCACDSEWGL